MERRNENERRRRFTPVETERRVTTRRSSAWSKVEKRWISGDEWLSVPRDDRYRFTLSGKVESKCSGDWRPIKLTSNKKRYSAFKAGSKTILFHVLIREYLDGPKPSGSQVCHGPVRGCNRPDNLRIASVRDNSLDRYRDGTMRCSLTFDDVVAIRTRRREGELWSTLSKDYRVPEHVVRAACNGETYSVLNDVCPPVKPKPYKGGIRTTHNPGTSTRTDKVFTFRKIDKNMKIFCTNPQTDNIFASSNLTRDCGR